MPAVTSWHVNMTHESAVTHHSFGGVKCKKETVFQSLQLSGYCSSASRFGKTEAK